MKKSQPRLVATFLIAVATTSIAAQAAVRSTEATAPKLPEIWEQAGPREQIKAARAAELDADRLLIERLYGVDIDANTTVGEFAMRDDSVAGIANSLLIGARTVGEPEYFDDGRVEVVKSVQIEKIIETIRRKTKEKLRADGSSEIVAFDEKTELASNGQKIEVMGNAALPGSLGHQKVMAKRAAELDAYRELSKQLMGIHIDSNTTVQDACLDSDELVGSLSRIVKGAEPVSIRHFDNGSCEVEMVIKRQDVVRAISNATKGRTHTTRIEDSIGETLFTAKGRGSMHTPEPASPPAPLRSATMASNAGGNDVFFETETIIRRLLTPRTIPQ
jgi:hypothetical protein